ncbi:hypothetical protein FRC11_001351 [Ceratobasidium sp. 423]|nr:hypothetical protein FRC11_001351 [Ceratobasidium sp. 423]
MHDPALLARLEEHLFDTQMARYRSKYPCSIFHVNTTYTPPVLPAHVSTQLEPVSSVPSEEEVVKVQDAIRSYQKFVEIPSMFDPKVHAELSQHLFDVQMARYIQRCGQANPVPQETVGVEPASAIHRAEQENGETNTTTNNIGSGAEVLEPHQPAQSVSTDKICDAIERSNQLAEQANQLVERSNQIAEQLTRVVEESNLPAEQSNRFFETFTELFGRLNGHFERSNHLVEASTKPVEKLADILGNMNKVLVRIQHAIVRNHKGNTLNAVDCLVNEKGPRYQASTPSIPMPVFQWW